MCLGFSHFSDFLHHFVFAKLATSSIRVNTFLQPTHAHSENVVAWYYDSYEINNFRIKLEIVATISTETCKLGPA